MRMHVLSVFVAYFLPICPLGNFRDILLTLRIQQTCDACGQCGEFYHLTTLVPDPGLLSQARFSFCTSWVVQACPHDLLPAIGILIFGYEG